MSACNGGEADQTREMVRSLDRLLDRRYDDQVRRRYRASRHLSITLWLGAVIGVLAALAALNVQGGFLGSFFAVLAVLVGFGSFTVALIATFKRRVAYRRFARLLPAASPAIMAKSPWTAGNAEEAVTFVHAWNDFEADAALVLDRVHADFDRQSLPSLLDALRSTNLLAEVDVDQLRVLIRLRNSIVHGTPTTVPPVAGTLLARVRNCLSEHVAASAESPRGAQPSPA